MGKILHQTLSYEVVGAAMAVHTELGLNYLEVVYQRALEHELTLRKVRFEREKRLQVVYKGVNVGDYIADFIVEDAIVLELKAAKHFHPQYATQALNYLAATNLRLAIVLCFGDNKLSYKRVVR